MKYRIRKRHVLIFAIAATQAVCLCWGVFVFGTWLRSSVQQIVHDQVLADNVQTAKQMITLIQQMDVADLRENPESWLRLQNTIRDIQLPNEGFICVIDAQDGGLLCHPALQEAPSTLREHLETQKNAMQKPGMEKPPMAKLAMQKPAMEKPALAKPEMHKPEMKKPRMAKPAMQKDTKQLANRSSEDHPSVGMSENISADISGQIVDYNGELQIIAAGYVSELDAHVNVHQLASGIEKNIARIMKPVVPNWD